MERPPGIHYIVESLDDAAVQNYHKTLMWQQERLFAQITYIEDVMYERGLEPIEEYNERQLVLDPRILGQ